MSPIGLSALLAAALAYAPAMAQNAPPDPLLPGAAAVSEAQDSADATKPAAAKPADSKSDVAAPRAALKSTPRRVVARRTETGGLSVTINNRRSVGLVELQLGPSGGELKKVQGPLAFGRKSVVHVPRAKDCLYDIKGHFADDADTEQTGLNLCKDKAINLTDE